MGYGTLIVDLTGGACADRAGPIGASSFNGRYFEYYNVWPRLLFKRQGRLDWSGGQSRLFGPGLGGWGKIMAGVR